MQIHKNAHARALFYALGAHQLGVHPYDRHHRAVPAGPLDGAHPAQAPSLQPAVPPDHEHPEEQWGDVACRAGPGSPHAGGLPEDFPEIGRAHV